MIGNIEILGKVISPYMIMVLIGIFVAGIYAVYLSRKYKVDENDTIVILLIAGIGVAFGGHMLYGITNYEVIIQVLHNIEKIDSFQMFGEVVLYIFGGSVFYGGLLGGLLIGSIYIKHKGYDIIFYAWLLAPCIPLFHFFGRIGCFLGGCCYGVESKIGFIYHYSIIEGANDVRRFPIQLVEAFSNLVLFFILSKLQKKESDKQFLLPIYLMSYAVYRFIYEFFRGDVIRGVYGWISTSQMISILVFIGTVLYIVKIKRNIKQDVK